MDFEIIQVENRQDERLLRGVLWRGNPAMKRLIKARAICDTSQSIDGRFFASLFETALEGVRCVDSAGSNWLRPSFVFLRQFDGILALECICFSEFLHV